MAPWLASKAEFDHDARVLGLGVWFRRLGRPALALLGLGAVIALVHSVGTEAVLATLAQAGPYLPLILVLDLSWVAFEGASVLVLYGAPARKIPPRAWLMATLVHYTTMTVLPVGRTGAEVARASMMSPWVGGARGAASAAIMQTLTLTANTIISMVCLMAVVTHSGMGQLAWLLLGNGVATLVLGGGLYLVMSRVRVGGFLGRRFEKLAHFGPELDEHFRESRSRHPISLLLTCSARTLQTLQYGVILLAVSGGFSAMGTLIAQGIHLVGAGLGDMVPNQVGVTEGAYRLFAADLDLGHAPEKAVSIALLARLSNLGVAGMCSLGMQFLRAPAGQTEKSASPPEATEA